MASSTTESDFDVGATAVRVTDELIAVQLEDGRTISVPTAWYPRLKHATPAERRRYEIEPYGVSWPDIEADFSIRGLLLGRKSGEAPASFKFWLDNRKKRRRVTFIDYMNRRRTKSPAAKKRVRERVGK
jgi:hypothetical protein